MIRLYYLPNTQNIWRNYCYIYQRHSQITKNKVAMIVPWWPATILLTYFYWYLLPTVWKYSKLYLGRSKHIFLGETLGWFIFILRISLRWRQSWQSKVAHCRILLSFTFSYLSLSVSTAFIFLGLFTDLPRTIFLLQSLPTYLLFHQFIHTSWQSSFVSLHRVFSTSFIFFVPT